MRVERVASRMFNLMVGCLVLVGCENNSTTDSGVDGGTDAMVDGRDADAAPTTDVPLGDVPGDVPESLCPASSTDAGPSDGGNTGPVNGYSVELTVVDVSNINPAASAITVAGAVTHISTATPEVPAMTSDDCVQFPLPPGGSDETPDINIGSPIVISQGTHTLPLNFDTTMMAYVANNTGFPPTSVVAGAPVQLVVPGAGGYPAGTTSLNFPPALPSTALFRGPFADPATPTISRSTATTVRWTPVADADLTVSIQAFARAMPPRNFVSCRARACRGSVTIPAAMAGGWTVGQNVQIQAAFIRTGTLPPTTRTPPLAFAVRSASAYLPLVTE